MMISDRKYQLKADLNPIENDFELEVNYVDRISLLNNCSVAKNCLKFKCKVHFSDTFFQNVSGI